MFALYLYLYLKVCLAINQYVDVGAVTVSMLYSLGVSQGRLLCLSQYYPKYSATTE